MFIGLRLGLFCGASLFSVAWVFCGVDWGDVVGFGGRKVLPLFRSWLLVVGMGKSLL